MSQTIHTCTGTLAKKNALDYSGGVVPFTIAQMQKKSLSLIQIFAVILVSILGHGLCAQHNPDSLLDHWNNVEEADSIRARAFYNYIEFQFLNNKPDTAFVLARQLLHFAEEKNYPIAQYYGIHLQGDSWYERAVYTKAIDCYLKCAELSEQINYPRGTATSLHMLGNIYFYQDNYDKSFEYWTNSLVLREKIGDKIEIAETAGNIGLIYQIRGEYDKAIEQMTHSLEVSQLAGDVYSTAKFLRNIGGVYFQMEAYKKALDFMTRSLVVAEKNQLDNIRANNHMDMGRIYYFLNNFTQSIASCKKSYTISTSLGDLYLKKESCDCLYSAYRALGQTENALTYYERFNAIEDSLQTTETIRKLQEMEFQKEALADSLAHVEKEQSVKEAHQAEVRRKNKLRNILAGGAILILIFAIGMYSRLRYIRRAKALIETEKERSDNLLLNILPANIAEELKAKGRVEARDFDMVSILFTDFKEFTATSEKLSAQELVAEINTCFESFDRIMMEFGIEKIKTIGDAYMAAGGLPLPTDISVKNTVLAALKMQQFIHARSQDQKTKGLPFFEMRLGIHTGPVVAGIVGVKKFQYDLWGDTVNTASRMESSGEVGKVNISQATYDILKNDAGFVFDFRGKVEVKGKGEMEMYFVDKNF